MRARRRLILLSAVVTGALLTGCVGSGGGPSDPRSGGGLAYGLAPQPDQGTTFQPDVVLVDGGASSVRSVTADGMTWTIAPSARGIGDLALGRILFLTDRAVGRVVAIQTTDAGVEVTVGPVDLTDVIKDGDFASAKPVPLQDPIALSAAGAFWADPAVQQQAGVEQGSGADVPVAPAVFDGPTRLADIPRPPAPPAIVAETAKASTGAFNLDAGCCKKGVHTALAYNKNGLSMTGDIALDMDSPTAEFTLNISGGTVKEAALSVRGAAGLTATLTALAAPGKPTHGFSPPLGMDLAFSVPVGVFFHVPLNMVVTQRFTVEVNIPGQAKLDAVGKLKLGSMIGFSYRDGKFSNASTATLDTAASLNGTNSLAVGISYASFDYNVRFTVGFGYFGFVAGVYLALASHMLAIVGAPIGFNPLPDAANPIEQCRSIQASLWLDYGVGYTVPAVVAQVVNFFLSAFHSQPVQASGGLSSGGWHPILNSYEVSPKSGFCVQK